MRGSVVSDPYPINIASWIISFQSILICGRCCGPSASLADDDLIAPPLIIYKIRSIRSPARGLGNRCAAPWWAAAARVCRLHQRFSVRSRPRGRRQRARPCSPPPHLKASHAMPPTSSRSSIPNETDSIAEELAHAKREGRRGDGLDGSPLAWREARSPARLLARSHVLTLYTRMHSPSTLL